MPWSFSALEAFELCPKKFWHERIGKTIKQQRSSVGDYGIEAHKAFENRLIRNKPLPLDLRQHEKYLNALAVIPGEGMPEQKMALNDRFQATGWFDDDVWVRAIADYAKVDGTQLAVVDHKFGKMKEGFDQIDLVTGVMMCILPEIETASGAYYWAKSKKFTKKKYTRDDLPAIWNGFMPRVAKMEDARKNDDYPARQNFLCRKYCKVSSCPYNGV